MESLPYELVSKIFGVAVPDWNNLTFEERLSYPMVSRQWHDLCTPLMFHTIKLLDQPRMVWGNSDPEILKRILTRLRETLETQRHLCKYVKVISIVIPNSNLLPGEVYVEANKILGLSQNCRQVTLELSKYDNSMDSIFKTIAELPLLKTLCLAVQNEPVMGRQYVMALTQFIRSKPLDALKLYWYDVSHCRPNELTGTRDLDDNEISKILPESQYGTANIRWLDIRHFGVASVELRALLTWMNSLEKLSISNFTQEEDVDTPGELTKLLKGKCKSIRHLKISRTMRGKLAARKEQNFLSLLSGLPCLEILQLSSLNVFSTEPEVLCQWLSDATNLRCLVIRFEHWEQVDYTSSMLGRSGMCWLPRFAKVIAEQYPSTVLQEVHIDFDYRRPERYAITSGVTWALKWQWEDLEVARAAMAPFGVELTYPQATISKAQFVESSWPCVTWFQELNRLQLHGYA
ncbi:MAG: hypothetical protein Q9227_002498 [Pyrenula ochraceoflavens]